jgi:hypothetical protein
MNRVLSPIIGRVKDVRKIDDTQIIKQLQMNVAMMGYRLNRGDIPPEIVRSRPDRYDAFRPYDLDSYGQGLLDATIPDRDVFPESKAEMATWVAVADTLTQEWTMRLLGAPDEAVAERAKAVADQEQADREQRAAMLSIAAQPVTPVTEEQEEGEEPQT